MQFQLSDQTQVKYNDLAARLCSLPYSDALHNLVKSKDLAT